MAKILFVEDETVLGRLVKEALERDKTWEIHWFENGRQAYGAYKTVQPDICVLDVMLPGMDGFELAGLIRETDKNVPILFLTARSQTTDIVKGFESGGNDYLKKPFSLEELTVRIKELLRRHGGQQTPVANIDLIKIGNYHFQPAMQMLKINGQTVNLSFKETELLHELAKHKNGLLDRKATLIKLWGDDNFFNARNMDVYIAKLRKHLAADPNLSIVNIRGFGFKLIEQV
jgi:DNA-binding response OmpR family regulator